MVWRNLFSRFTGKRLALTGAIAVLSLVVTACGGDADTPTPPTDTPRPTATATPTLAPGQTRVPPTATPTPRPAATATAIPAWQIEWDRTVAAARLEGKVVISGALAAAPRAAYEKFQEAYPEIEFEYFPTTGSQIGPRITVEREAGVYAWDVYGSGTGSGHERLVPIGAFVDLRKELILPEVTSDAAWFHGLEAGWADLAAQYIYVHELSEGTSEVQVNSQVYPDWEDLVFPNDLLDPKFKGKFILHDPRGRGGGAAWTAQALILGGEEFYRRFLTEMDVTLSRDLREIAQSIINGDKPLGVGGDIANFQQQGIGDHVKLAQLSGRPDPSLGLAIIGNEQAENIGFASPSWGSVAMFANAPHPNAARVFINWLLSKEGQQAWVDAHEGLSASRRADLDDNSDLAVSNDNGYVVTQYEANTPIRKEAQAIAIEIFGR